MPPKRSLSGAVRPQAEPEKQELPYDVYKKWYNQGKRMCRMTFIDSRVARIFDRGEIIHRQVNGPNKIFPTDAV